MMQNCPKCLTECYRDEVEVVSGYPPICGPYGCPDCGWSESPEYDLNEGESNKRDHGSIDQFGGLIPREKP